MNVLAKTNLRVLFHLSKTRQNNLSTNVGRSQKVAQNIGNNYLYENVVKNFQWKIPEYWNFAQVSLFFFQMSIRNSEIIFFVIFFCDCYKFSFFCLHNLYNFIVNLNQL